MPKKLDIKDPRVCEKCPSFCCYNLAFQIDRPRDKFDVDDLKWRLHFDKVKVFIKDRLWYFLIESKCIYLGEDSLCTNYEARPEICRKHNPPECELNDDGRWYDVLISTPKGLDEYIRIEKEMRKRRRKRRKRTGA